MKMLTAEYPTDVPYQGGLLSDFAQISMISFSTFSATVVGKKKL